MNFSLPFLFAHMTTLYYKVCWKKPDCLVCILSCICIPQYTDGACLHLYTLLISWWTWALQKEAEAWFISCLIRQIYYLIIPGLGCNIFVWNNGVSGLKNVSWLMHLSPSFPYFLLPLSNAILARKKVCLKKVSHSLWETYWFEWLCREK